MTYPLLLLFLSFMQVGLFGIGGSAGSQALLENEIITFHQWLTPAQFADVMVFCRVLPGGTGMNVAAMSGYFSTCARFGFWGAAGAGLVSVVSLVIPSVLWTSLIVKLQKSESCRSWLECVMVVLRPLVPGLIAAAAIIMMRRDIFSSMQTNPWDFCVSVFLFLATLVGVGLYRFNAVFMVILCGIAGWILL